MVPILLGNNYRSKSQELAKAQAEIAKLTRKVQKHEEAVKETESKNLYLRPILGTKT